MVEHKCPHEDNPIVKDSSWPWSKGKRNGWYWIQIANLVGHNGRVAGETTESYLRTSFGKWPTCREKIEKRPLLEKFQKKPHFYFFWSKSQYSTVSFFFLTHWFVTPCWWVGAVEGGGSGNGEEIEMVKKTHFQKDN